MTQLHFHHIAGQEHDIIAAIIQTPEVVAVGGAMGPVHLVVEELVVNIVNYAYQSEGPQTSKGDYLDVETDLHGERLTIRLRDGGVPFNPLEQASPDTSLPMSQRKKGGLGILLVKKETDELTYEHTDGENVLTIGFDVGDKTKTMTQ